MCAQLIDIASVAVTSGLIVESHRNEVDRVGSPRLVQGGKECSIDGSLQLARWYIRRIEPYRWWLLNLRKNIAIFGDQAPKNNVSKGDHSSNFVYITDGGIDEVTFPQTLEIYTAGTGNMYRLLLFDI